MKLVVMIPAYNEERTIGKVIKEIPREIEGINVCCSQGEWEHFRDSVLVRI